MKAPEIPANEPFRLAALYALPLLDTPPEADFESIVLLGQALLRTPTCVVTLVDRDRQWFKARIGLDAPETSREVSFCGHAILQDDLFVVLNAKEDERFHDNPLVTGPPHIRFYAGAPIRLPNGYTIGTVCAFGPEPREAMSPEERQWLRSLADLALAAIGVRALRENLDRAASEAGRIRSALMAVHQPVAFADLNGQITLANDAFAQFCTAPPVEGTSITAALNIEPMVWSPSAMIEADHHEAQIPPDGGRPALAVWRDMEGFVLMGE